MDRKGLIKLIADNFARWEELDELFFEIGVEGGNILGSTISAKARELFTYMERRGRVNDLLQAVVTLRPHLEEPMAELGWKPGGAAAPTRPVGVTQPPTTPVTATAVATGLTYENFDLRIGRKGPDGRYPIEVTRAPNGGEMAEPVYQTFPLDDYDFTDLVGYLSDLVARSADAVELGKQLRSLLFPDEVWNIFYANRIATRQQGKGMRIRLRVDAPELSQLPWEYVYDDTFRFFALQRETPLVRYMPRPFAAESVSAPSPMKVLLAIAAPKDQATLSVDEEEKRIRNAVAFMGDAVQLTVLRNATPEKLHGALAARPHVFHFIGHGVVQNSQGALVFENIFGQSQLLDADQLLFLMGNTGVKVVILNACKTAAHDARDAMMGVAPALVAAEIPAVIAMQFNVPDRTAVGFTRDLYRFLAAGYPLDAAVTEMRIGAYIGANDKYYWGIPALFMRAPDGVIWQPNPEAMARFAAAQEAAAQLGGPDLGQLLDEILADVTAVRAQMRPGDADDALDDLNDLKEMIGQVQPNLGRINRKLNNLQDILTDSAAAGANAIVPKVQQAIDLAKEKFS